MQSLSYSILEQIVASSVQGILLVELAGPNRRIRYANAAYEALSGYSSDELIGTRWSDYFGDGAGADEWFELERLLSDGAAGQLALPFRSKDGEQWHSPVLLSPIAAIGNEPRLMLVQHTQASADPKVSTALLEKALGRARRELASLHTVSATRGLLSADEFAAVLGRDLAIAGRDGRSVSIIFFEVVELDAYRETFGALAADACLRMIGRQLSGTFGRAGDLCARLGGALFAASVQGQGEAEAEALARRAGEKVRSLCLHNPHAKSARRIALSNVVIPADPERDDAAGLLARGRAALKGQSAEAADQRASLS